MKVIRVGTRGSKLALWQTQWVINRLRSLYPGFQFEPVVIKVTSDRSPDAPISAIGQVGVFTKDIEQALLVGDIHLAVHSLKDLPTLSTPGTVIAAFTEREDPRDCILWPKGQPMPDLNNSRVGTSSVRRSALVRSYWPNANVVNLRGNVDTRVRKMLEGNYDVILMAYAAVKRMNLPVEFKPLPLDSWVPSAGQGIIAVQAREDDQQIIGMLNAINFFPSKVAYLAERSLMRALGGGCSMPVGAYAELHDGELSLTGMVAAPDGSQVVITRRVDTPDQADHLGERVAREMLDLGIRLTIS